MHFCRTFLILLTAVLPCCAAHAVPAQADTTECASGSCDMPALRYGVPMLVAGSALSLMQGAHNDMPVGGNNPSRLYEDVLRFSPSALWLSLRLSDAPSRDRSLVAFEKRISSYLLTAAVVQGLKLVVSERRPDGTNHRSFPSGHTAIAFSTATMIAHEYGSQSWLYPALGYSLAAATGIGRIVEDHHWAGDVIAGAGIGMCFTELSCAVVDLLNGRRVAFSPLGDGRDVLRRQRHADMEFSLLVPSAVHIGDIVLGRGCRTSLTYAYGLHPYLALSARVALDERPYTFESSPADQCVKRSVALALGPRLTIPLTTSFAIDASCYAGYQLQMGSSRGVWRRGGSLFGSTLSARLMATSHVSYSLSLGYDSARMLRGCSASKSLSCGLGVGYNF